MMRFRSVSLLGAFLLLALAVAAWSTPLPASLASLLSLPPETHAVSGKISSVGDTQFTLDVLKNQKPSSMQFLIDEHTSVEGKLAVGAQAAVDYRVDGEKIIATHVVITKASGVMTN